MSNTKITSAEVAKLAGVSQSAVSRVFTPGASASKSTTERVKKVANDLGYRPNVLARAMVSGKSRMIGIVVAYLENQFYPEAIEKLSNVLQSKGYHALIFMAGKNMQSIDGVIEEILDYQVDGIITASVSMSSNLTKRCTSPGVPMVLFNRSQDVSKMSSVTSDNIKGGKKIADFLLSLGHSKIGYIAGWEGASTQRDREKGFISGLSHYGTKLYNRKVGNFVMDEAKEATRKMFHKNPPDAVFVANDHMAFAVMDTLRFELGFRIPEDVSVVGYDDVPAASWPSFSLTTVQQPVDTMVQKTVDILLKKIEHEEIKPQKITVDGPLIIRGSTIKPKG